MAKEIGRQLGMEEYSEVVRLFAEAVTMNAIMRGAAVRAGYDDIIPMIDRLAGHLNELGSVVRIDPAELSAEYERINRKLGVAPNLSS